MKRDKFTTCPADVDDSSHRFSDPSSPRDEYSESEEGKSEIINKIVDWVLSQPWWVIVILAIIGVGLGLLAWYLTN